MPSFNLVRQPWIPVLIDGPPEEVSLAEVFGRAHEIRAVADPSPLVTAAIYRLLIAIAERVLPTDDASWAELWRAGDIRAVEIQRYVEKWESRFDLFDAEYPFGQTVALSPDFANTAAKLSHERNAGNNAALFDHSLDDQPEPLTPAEAARALLALQAFAVGGLVTFEKGQTQDKSADAAPLTKGAVVIATGETLASTILLNLFRRTSERPFPHDPGRDRPAWERDEPTRPMDRWPDGPLDLLTWQSRRVRLIASERGADTVVDRAVIMKGYQFPTGFALADYEPMLAFIHRRRAAANQDPKPPLGFRPGKALWRDSMALIQSRDPTKETDGRQLPKTFEDLRGRDLAINTVGVSAFGLGVDRAKLLLWRNDQLPLSLRYLREGEAPLRNALERGIELAESVDTALRTALFVLASNGLAPAGGADPARVRAVMDSLGAQVAYWAALDPHFRRFMADLAATFDADEGVAARVEWRDAVRIQAVEALNLATTAFENTGYGVRAGAEARGVLDRLLLTSTAAFTATLPQEVTA